jgi:hypothetical protein
MESAWPEIWALASVKHRVLRGVRCAVVDPGKSERGVMIFVADRTDIRSRSPR